MGFGDRLKQRRTALHLSQQEVAKRCGWDSRNRVSQYELEAREPKGADFEKLARVLETTPSWLRFGSIDKTKVIDETTIIDAEMLGKILTVVSQVEDELHQRLDPRSKGDLVAALYDDAKNGESPDALRVRKWFKVAARR